MFDRRDVERFLGANTRFNAMPLGEIDQVMERLDKVSYDKNGHFSASLLGEILGSDERVCQFHDMWENHRYVFNVGR